MKDNNKYVIVGDKKLTINKFSLDMMEDHPAIILVAKRRSGKSWVCRDILRHYKNKIPAGIVISKSEELNEPFYSEFLADSFIYHKFETKILEKLFKRQIMMIKKKKEKKNNGTLINPSAFLLMDDCLSDKGEWGKDQLIYELMYNGRHYKILFMLTMQSPLGISPDLRSNFDYFILLATDIENHMKKLYDNYAGMFKNVKEFKTVFKQLTVNHQAMVVANTGADKPFKEKIFWFKASDTKVGSIGCDQLNQYHLNNYDKTHKDKMDKLLGLEI